MIKVKIKIRNLFNQYKKKKYLLLHSEWYLYYGKIKFFILYIDHIK